MLFLARYCFLGLSEVSDADQGESRDCETGK